MKKLLILAALGAAASAGTVAAQPATMERTAIVQHRDLDLGTEAGANTLKHRIWRAVVDVCGTASDADLEGKNDVRNCRQNTLQQAAMQAGHVVASATRDEPIQISALGK